VQLTTAKGSFWIGLGQERMAWTATDC